MFTRRIGFFFGIFGRAKHGWNIHIHKQSMKHSIFYETIDRFRF